MDRITSQLNYQTGKAYHPSLAAAMKLARKKMDRYYSLTDSSNVYRIAMVLHPGIKLEYFRNQKWEDEWIDEAECLVREEYAAKYETVAEELTEESNDMLKKNLSMKINDGFASFGNLSVTTSPRPNEIQEYLSHAVENVKDPLKWWVENKYVYPKLYRMALDYLSIPATSTSVERVFSQGCHLLPFSRNSLSPSSIRAFLCFGSWSRCGLVVLEDVVDAVTARMRA
jgi:hypothetical protein